MIAQVLVATPPPVDTLEAWWLATAAARGELAAPIERAACVACAPVRRA